MIGGLKKTTSRFAVAAAAGLFLGGIAVSPAQAADLGGDCCADLEERVAELEATTVRKGNRRVSVTLSGQVNRMLLFWDDGDESNVYEVDNSNSSSRINLTGSATIRPGWTAGFRFIYELDGTDSGAVTQLDDDGGTNGDQNVEIREANWWIRSDQLGEIKVGRLSSATKGIISLDLGGSIGGSNDIRLIGTSFRVRQSGVPGTTGLVVGTSMGEFMQNVDLDRWEGVLYTTPTFGGARVLVSWGEDDNWDVGLWYSKEWNSVRVVAGIGYQEFKDEDADALDDVQFDDGDTDFSTFKGSASIMHVPSGLFFTAAFANIEYNGNDGGELYNPAGTTGFFRRPDFEWLYLSGGIRKRWNSLGQSSIYGEWSQGDDGITNRNELAGLGAAGANIVTDSEFEMWGIGVEQDIDNASMQLYAAWRHFQFDASTAVVAANGAITAGTTTAIALEDLDLFYVGARIRF